MNTKLALWLDEKLIASAIRYSAASGRSVSQLVADFFSLLEAQSTSTNVEVTHRARALRGVLAGPGLDEGKYLRHLEDKHL